MPKPPEYMFACEFERISPGKKDLHLPSGKILSEDVFISGALTERSLNKMQKRVFMRVADATGVFIVSAPEKSPVAESLLSLKVPSFVSVYGRLSSGYYEGRLHPLIIPYAAKEISSEVRDSLVTETAKRTVQRIKGSGRPASDIIPVLNSAKLMLGTVRERAGSDTVLPFVSSADGASTQAQAIGADDASLRDEVIIPIIKAGSGKKGIIMDELFNKCRAANIPDDRARSILKEMLTEGDCYMPPGGYLKLL
ncbi:hypothetical protein [Methanoplanus endosymbiosus]|uniref:Uncharacterized protein n=1 Tax=Methanoplanus endosymbiosus TaxID=33865 RepID=A0A9E7TJS2_9EURY|nr:hypothetical protein [Methanoplanus endosymbiosus]UUX92114.1 hypothetical protein L6E24_12230 [Methanoplanus endosymbiosus]